MGVWRVIDHLIGSKLKVLSLMLSLRCVGKMVGA
tara:strand:- start:3741 stop:3842 length:102 start_codon:yes stop_codon:yes gene_type:complete